MGKGDKKSRRGKIILGTFGVRRLRKKDDKPVVKPVPVTVGSELKESKPAKEKSEVKEIKPVAETRETKAVKEKVSVKAPKPAKEKKS